jgi:lactoylglutathione lyase
VLAAQGRLRTHGITPLSFDEEETTEPSVLAWMPAAAVYFHDPDGHLLEYLAMLDDEPMASVGTIPYSRWVAPNQSRG